MVSFRLELQEFLVAFIEFFLLERFTGKGFYYANAKQTIFNLGIKLTDVLSRFREVFLHFKSEEDEHGDHKGDYREYDKSQRNTHSAEQNK